VGPRRMHGGPALCWHDASASRHAAAVQGFAIHQPACLEEMWRCGALPGLIVSVAKGAAQGKGHDMAAILELLRRILRPPAADGAGRQQELQQEPWFAASSERQQFVLFTLAHIGGAAASIVIDIAEGTGAAARERVARAGAGSTGTPLARFMAKLLAIAQQLGREPLLCQQLEVAAPALLPSADAAAATGDESSCDGHLNQLMMGVTPEPLRLLVGLRRQLNPLALGLSLPGCYNPACTSVAGDSEAAMVLERCDGCKIAR